MRYTKYLRPLSTVLLSAAICLPSSAQDKPDKKNDEKPAGAPSEADTAAMMELSKPGENHKLLASGVGQWTYTVKAWTDPDPKAPPTTSSGTSVVKPMMGGRFFTSEHTGKMQMPGPDGKMTDTEFKGMSIDGYDNVKKKFVASWVDNMGTGILLSEGDYDTATKTFTYRMEVEMMPGVKTKVRNTIKVVDNDHRTFEIFEERGDKEAKTMEINYARSPSNR